MQNVTSQKQSYSAQTKWLSSLTTWSYIQLPFHIISFLNVLNLIQHHFPNSPSANASLSVSNFLMSVLLIVGSEHRRGHFEIDGIKITATAAALVTGEYANRIIYLCMKAIMQKHITSRHVFKKDTFCTEERVLAVHYTNSHHSLCLDVLRNLSVFPCKATRTDLTRSHSKSSYCLKKKI